MAEVEQPTVVVHVLAADTSPQRGQAAAALAGRDDVGIRQLLLYAGVGRPPIPTGHPIARVHVPCLPTWLGPSAIRRAVARTAEGLANRSAILHAWSRGAAAQCVRLASDSCPVLIHADWDDDLRATAQLSRRGSVFVVCTSCAIRERLTELGARVAGVAAAEACIETLPSGRELRSAVRDELGLLSGQRAILILPPISRLAGAFHAAWGALLLEKVRDDVRLIVPADGREVERIRRLVYACRHTHMACFAPPHLTLRHLLAAADLAVFTPPTSAPVGAVVKAMAAGCPVVATEVPAVTELLTDEHSAWLCPPRSPQGVAQRMYQALEDVARSTQFAERARAAAVAAFRADLQIGEYRRIYALLARRQAVGASQAVPG